MVPDLGLRVVMHVVVVIADVEPSEGVEREEVQVMGIALLGGCLSEMNLTAMAMAIKTLVQPAHLV